MLAFTRQPPLLQREVPLRRHVRIVNQHQPRVRPQPARLLHHRLLILRHELRPKVRRNRRNKRHPIRNVPSRNHIDPASRRRHRSHRRQRSKPRAPRPFAFTARIVSYRRFGSTKSIVVTGFPSNLYGAEFDEGACADIRNPAFRPPCSLSSSGSNFFVFSWMLAPLRHHHARCTNGPCAGSINPIIP